MNAVAQSAVQPAVEAVDAAQGERPPRGSWTFDDAQVIWAVKSVDNMDALDQLKDWKAEAAAGPGGAPEKFGFRPLLVAMTLAARDGLPFLATTFRDILFKHISGPMREALGVPEPPDDDDHLGWKACYRNVRTRLHSMLSLVNPSPFPKNRRRDPEAFEAATLDLDPATIAVRRERLLWLANRIIEASIQELPREIRRKWKGSVAVDGTPIPAFARPSRKMKSTSGDWVVQTHSSDPDAAWYVREGDHRDRDLHPRGKTIKKRVWAYEATFVVMGAEDPSTEAQHPMLIVGMGVLDKPGFRPGPNAIDGLRDLQGRHQEARYLIGDLLFPNSKPETYQLPARALGYEHVIDYRDDQLGLQDQYAGAIMVEGWWYSPGMPQRLIDATILFRAGRATETEYQQLLAERAKYRLRVKDRNADGDPRMMCPAAGASPLVQCALKDASVGIVGPSGLKVFPNPELTKYPPSICDQGSVTFPPQAGAKFEQALQFGTEEWHVVYRTLRSTVEGANGSAKDPAFEGLDLAGRRRIRGVAFQTIATAFAVFASNLRRIDTFQALQVVEDDGSLREPRRRRKTEPLESYRPTGPADQPGDPPLCA